ncbi:putative outer membrane protein assembly factor [Escherichia coli]|uniref:Putative outer membrane protein assembly factor n=1 Tax=Escherichia coli TaxID=562 RepID=A0A377CE28_ECOLX|nr:putative outer membrane protein assembly factor [Escherichia coli]
MTFEGSQIRDEYLQKSGAFKEGDEYESKDLAELNRRLSATGWFNSVVVAPQFDKARETKVLPLTGVVSPRHRKHHRNRCRFTLRTWDRA